MILNTKLIPQTPATHKWLSVAILALSFIGFADASYLSAEHFLGVIPPCSLTQGCEKVLTSPYAAFWGIPTALLGVLFYIAIFILIFLYWETERQALLRILAFVATIGFLVSLMLVYLQFFVIHAICLYCMGSAATSTLIFILSLCLFKQQQAKTPASPAKSAI